MAHTIQFDPTAEVLRTVSLSYTYAGGHTIHFPDIRCFPGQHLLISGRSGVGKTTLLHLIGGLLRVQRGEVNIGGQTLSALSNSELDRFRGRYLGLVFQQARFVSSLHVMDNVLAAQYFGSGKAHRPKALALLAELGLENKAHKSALTLSGGEKQRLSIARALASGAKLVLADEPTSGLDDVNADVVYQLLRREADLNGATLVVVTHDSRLKARFENKIEL